MYPDWNRRKSGSWRERDDPENRACEISLVVSAPQSTAASFVRREFKRHLFVVDSLLEQTWTNDHDPPCSHLSTIPTIT